MAGGAAKKLNLFWTYQNSDDDDDDDDDDKIVDHAKKGRKADDSQWYCHVTTDGSKREIFMIHRSITFMAINNPSNNHIKCSELLD